MSESAMFAGWPRRGHRAIAPFGEDCSSLPRGGANTCAARSGLSLCARLMAIAECEAQGGCMKRWLVACLVFAAACHPTPTPTPPGSNPAQLCKRAPITGVAAAGGSLLHAAEFSMVMIESCGFDMTKLVDAARTCRDTGSCGIELDQGGLTLVNEAAGSTWTTVSLGGGRAFQTKTGDRNWVAWDASRDPVQVLT